jgi:nucleoside-diphosphate-sugar epimerase
VKIGITGNNGFIGGNVSRSLAGAGHEVISLDPFTRFAVFSKINAENYPKELDWVLHFGAKTSISDSFLDPYETYANNIGSTLHALKIASNRRAHFLFMSSYVYGQPRYIPIDEKHPVEAANPYMASKIVGEEMCRRICGLEGIPAIILRGFNIFGEHCIPGRLISDLLDAIRGGVAIHLNDPAPVRDYLYIKDFTDLILKIVVRGLPEGICTYNVGYGQSYSNLEVAELVCELANSKRQLIVSSNPRRNDIPDCSVDTGLVRDAYSWQPEYSLRRALTELINNLHIHDKSKKGFDRHD